MTVNQWIYLAITACFAIVFVAMVVYYFSGKRYKEIEEPKFKIIENESDGKNLKAE